MKRLWNWHIIFIRKYPVTCAYAAWVEGLVIGLIVYGVMGCEWAF